MPIAAPSPRSSPVLRRVHLLQRKRHRSSLQSSKSSSLSPLPSSFYMLRSLLAVGCGCFVGGILRYLLTLLLPGAADGRFPWSTFAANALGCLLIGLLSGVLSRTVQRPTRSASSSPSDFAAASPPFPPSWPTAAPFGSSNSPSPPSPTSARASSSASPSLG